MAREHASIGVEIWGDSDFRNLTPQAQALWMKLYTHPALSYAGVVDFHPGRLAAQSLEQSPLDVLVAAQELSTKHWIVVDQDTDEVMVRGFLRHDGLLKQPRLAVSAAKAYAAIGSNKIRAVVVHEVQRYRRENPDLAAWDHPQVKGLLKQQATAVQETETELRLPADQAPALDYGQRYGQASDQTSTSAQPAATPTPTPSPTPAPRSDDLAPHDRTESEPTIRARAVRLNVDFDRVAKRFTEQANETVEDETVMRVITTVISRARPQRGDRTGLVLRSLRDDWAEWAPLVYFDPERDRLVAAGIEPPTLEGIEQ